ncbi:MAG: hypothetical protein ABSB59_18345 [Streptosporangiaceae bacterium]|jgi:hypothetical protein
MGHDTYSYYDVEVEPADEEQPETYWRRRVIALCAGLVLLAVLAWAFSGGGGKAPSTASTAQKGSQATGVLPAAAYSSSTSSPTGASGSAPASSASVGSAATLPFPATTSPRGGQSAHATAAGAATGKAEAGNAAPSGVEPNGDCAPGSVVLSLFASRTAYYAGQHPAFQIYAVSTASRACAFDMSPHRLHVQVISSGRTVWDSADCVRGEPNRVIKLRRGVPAETWVTWRRVVSLPGCVTVAPARPGSYQARAKDTSVASPVSYFRLVR